ncbi:MAG: alpha/beta fold hydrolase, partial [Actinomycetota bacterium]
PQARHARLQTAALAREKGTGALIDELLPRLLSHRAPEQVRARVRVMFEETPGETAAADALAMRDRSDSTMDLTSIDVPALVVHGVEDTPAPLAGAEAMARLIPEAGFVPIPAAGHLSPMENPEAVNLALREFLRGLD